MDGIQFIDVTQKNYESSIQLFFNKKQSSSTREVSYQEIRKRDYILMFSNYDPIFTEVELEKNNGLAFSIGEIAQLYKPTKSVNRYGKSKYPCIKVDGLTSSIRDKYLIIDYTVEKVYHLTKQIIYLTKKQLLYQLLVII